MPAVNILTSEPLTFDSSRQKITPKHILATSGYPSDNFPWVELEEGVYAWDDALLSNTPFSEVTCFFVLGLRIQSAERTRTGSTSQSSSSPTSSSSLIDNLFQP